MIDSNICAKCHEIGSGCCFLKDTSQQSQVGILSPDINKIKNHLNIDEDSFIVKDTVNDEFRESLSKNIHPIFDKVFYNNIAFRLKVVDGKCVFLSGDGCTLPKEVRPLYCRIYPFLLSADNKNIVVLSSYDCLAQGKSTLSWRIVNEYFEYNEEYVRGLFEELEKACDEHVSQFRLAYTDYSNSTLY